MSVKLKLVLHNDSMTHQIVTLELPLSHAHDNFYPKFIEFQRSKDYPVGYYTVFIYVPKRLKWWHRRKHWVYAGDFRIL